MIPSERAFQQLQNACFSLSIGYVLTKLWPLECKHLRASICLFLLQVRLLESSGRIGGRIHDDHSLGRCVGMGAMFITGVANNPFTLLSQQLNHPLRIINEETCELFNESGGHPDKQLDLATEGHYNTTLDRLAEWRSRQGNDISLESTLLITL